MRWRIGTAVALPTSGSGTFSASISPRGDGTGQRHVRCV
jgi:hypothetical protein